MSKIKYYDISKILSYDACYYVIYGERSNGKTYGALTYCLEQYFEHESEFAYIRRWDDDLKGNKGGTLFDSHISNGLIKKLSKGKFTGVKYIGRAWYFTHKEGNELIVEERPFAYAFALTMQEHYKSNSYPKIRNIIFDEFLTRGYYLPDEFTTFMNLLSTLIRLRDDVKIFMLGNTVNKYGCPHIAEMGLYKIGKQEKGTIDIYTYGETELRVAVEFSDFPTKDKKSNKYFAFDNPRLNMIKNGAWEIDIYPHFPTEYGGIKPREILYTFFIIFERNTLECNVVELEERTITDSITNEKKILPCVRFIFIHPKTTPIKDEHALIYTIEANVRPNYRRRIDKPLSKVEKRILYYFARDKVFYSDNEVGEIVRNYMQASMM